MNKVAFLSRVSTNDQHDSIINQEEIFNQWLKKHQDCVLFKKYVDEGISGSKGYKRQAWLQMLSDGQEGLFDILIAKSFSRFGRNQTETLSAIKLLIAQNIRIIFLEDNLDSKEDMSKFGLFAWLAEQEAQKGSERIKMVWQNFNTLGKVHVTIEPLGYTYDKSIKNFIINEEEVPVIKEIFNLYLQGFGFNKIAQILTEKNIQTKKGGKWAGQTIATILRNDFYIGTLTQGKTQTLDVTMRENKKIDKEEWFRHKNHHEAIIDIKIFEKVQEEIKKRSHKATDSYKTRHSNTALFSSILKCRNCGATMTIKRKKRMKNYKPFYQCIEYDLHSLKCGHQSNLVYEDFLIIIIKNKLDEAVKNNYSEINKKLHAKTNLTDKNKLKVELKNIEKKLEEQGKIGNKLVNLLTSGTITAEQFALQNNIVVKQITELNNRKEKIKNEINKKNDTQEKLAELQENIENLLNTKSENWTNAMMRSIIEKIEISTNGLIEVFYKYM